MTETLRQAVMKIHAQIAQDPVTAPAAFGVCCQLIRNELGCTLRVAALLLEEWISTVVDEGT